MTAIPRLKPQALSDVALRIAPLSSTSGARINRLNLSRPLSDEVIHAIHRALLRYEVLFFDSQTLTPAELRDFAARFG